MFTVLGFAGIYSSQVSNIVYALKPTLTHFVPQLLYILGVRLVGSNVASIIIVSQYAMLLLLLHFAVIAIAASLGCSVTHRIWY